MKNQIILFTTFFMITATTYGQRLKDTVVDIDGNVYHTVKIGTQVWMVENLKVTHYSNGDTIPNVIDSIKWSKLTTGAYCNYNNDTNIAITYGRLYNWYALNDSSNIAPKGWHVPTINELKNLQIFLGGDWFAGGKLKESRTKHWIKPNKGANNKSGFSALPGGMRKDNGLYTVFNSVACFWTITEDGWPDGNWFRSEAAFRKAIEKSKESAYDFNLYSDMTNLSISISGMGENRKCGLSVRLIKD